MGLSFCAFLVLYCSTEAHESAMKTNDMPSKMLWLFCMMLGFYIHEYHVLRPRKEQRYWYICVLVLLFLYVISKYIISRGYFPYFKCMPTVVSVVTAPLLLFVLLNGEEYNKNIVASVSKNTILQAVSSSSLEIWYVSWVFIEIMSGLVFPLNWVCITLSSIITAYILHKLSEMLIRLCCRQYS